MDTEATIGPTALRPRSRSRHDKGRLFQPSPAMVRAVLNLTSDLVLFLNPDDYRLVDANQAACAALGYSNRELLELPLSAIVSANACEKLAKALTSVAEAAAPCLIVARTSSGAEIRLEATVRRLPGGRGCIVIIGRDVSERERLDALAAHRANLDPLTGLPNRAVLESRLEALASGGTEPQQRVAVFFIDLDGFKRINDERGHLAGDAVLKVVGSRLAHSLRTGDLLVRYGGDEFIVLIERVADEAEATGLADRMLRALKSPIQVGSDEISVSASIGIAISAASETTPTDLLGRADRGMYRAKALGRNRQFVIAMGPSQFGP